MARTANLGTALITGASAGIGATYAAKLAQRGYDLLLVARDGARLEALGREFVAKFGISAEALTADLSDPADTRRVEARLRSDDKITLLVNNAGIGPKGPLLADDIDYLDRMIAINVTAANRLAVAAAQTFAGRGSGAIINIASGVAIAPELFNAAYSGSKSFIFALTLSMARELEGTGVKVQAVLPGITRTELFDRVGADVENYPKEIVMDVEDLVDAALAGFEHGELITIPSVEDSGLIDAFEAARADLGGQVSRDTPASRYTVSRAAA
jgi:short-subunit dehydrogenase